MRLAKESPTSVSADFLHLNENESVVHVAIVDSRTARLILEGKKTIETRFAIKRNKPYGRINSGDLIFIKKSGGPIVAKARAGEVRFYSDLDADKISILRRSYNNLVKASSQFWQEKKHAKYATFFNL